MKYRLFFPLSVILAMLISASGLSAHNAAAPEDEGGAPQKGWYIGVEGGLPFGVSTFTSFGHDKTRFGWTGGLYGGYRFNPVLSAEVVAKYGQMTLASCSYCADHGYWLGADGARYNVAVLGQEGWDYSALQSKVNIGQYGARLNVNLLGFFSGTRNSRWSLSLSPHLYAVSTKADIQTISDKTSRIQGGTDWHLGYGGDIQVACHLTRTLQLGLYSGVTALTGARMDALPVYLHKCNFVWESGIRLGFVFGRKNRAAKKGTSSAPVTYPAEPTQSQSEPQKPASEEPQSAVEEPQENAAEPEQTTRPQKESESPAANEPAVSFPDVYFGFDKTTLSGSEESSLQEILAKMNENPQMKITVRGWCDRWGTEAVNSRYSTARAEAVKKWLVARGISADRIETVGMGIDRNAATSAKARHASVETQKN